MKGVTNKRNSTGVKNSSDCYLEGGNWYQWTDFIYDGSREIMSLSEAREEIAKHKKEYPNREFKYKKYDGKYYRIYATDL